MSVAAGDRSDADSAHDLNIIGSKIDAKGKVDLGATDNVTIGEARDTAYSQLDTRSKRMFSKKQSHSRTETETAVGSSISGGEGVDISSGKDTTISASKVQAGTTDNKADLNIDAGGDLIPNGRRRPMAAAYPVAVLSSPRRSRKAKAKRARPYLPFHPVRSS